MRVLWWWGGLAVTATTLTILGALLLGPSEVDVSRDETELPADTSMRISNVTFDKVIDGVECSVSIDECRISKKPILFFTVQGVDELVLQGVRMDVSSATPDWSVQRAIRTLFDTARASFGPGGRATSLVQMRDVRINLRFGDDTMMISGRTARMGKKGEVLRIGAGTLTRNGSTVRQGDFTIHLDELR